ncbi:hypothetical protein [Flagellimonas flava]|uniref:hypothetical protein n=1 Tax=Flagellimonas flava TaxID=570519 RepID=UPI003D6611D0
MATRLFNALALLLLCSGYLYAQRSARTPEEQLYQLHRENLEEWKNSSEVQKLLQKHPQLQEVISGINPNKVDQSDNYKVMGFLQMLTSEELLSSEVDMMMQILSPENVGYIEDFYWMIINSPKSKKVADLVVDHLQNIRQKLETEISSLNKN